MFRTRAFWAVLSVVVGLLQVWDSGAFGAGLMVGALALSGIAVVVTALVAGFALLTAARVMAPSSLNTLHLALFVPAVYLLVAFRWFEPEPARN